MNKILKIALLAIGVSVLSASAMAAGFGVNGNESTVKPTNYESSSVMKLIGAKQPTASAPALSSALLKERQGAVPKDLRVQQSSANNNALGSTGVGKQSFTNMIRNLMPLSPAQIKTLRLLFDKSQRAAVTFPGTPPRPTSRSVIVNLSPGGTPPIIRLRAGYVTSLVFLDSTGQPWPVQAIDIGDPKAFNVEWNRKGNTLLVEALDRYKSGNLAVMLKGLDTPVMVTLMPGQKAVDYSVQLRVPGMGPNAKPNLATLPNSANPELLNFLDGVPPSGAKRLTVVGGGRTEAWEYKGHLFVRSRLTILSPGFLARMSSPDGTSAYELGNTPVVLGSFHGQVVQMKIKGLGE